MLDSHGFQYFFYGCLDSVIFSGIAGPSFASQIVMAVIEQFELEDSMKEHQRLTKSVRHCRMSGANCRS